MDSAMRNLWIIPLAIVFSAIHASGQDSTKPSLATPEDHSKTTWLVRPCTANETAIGSSPEVIRLFPDERPVFQWCEALDVPWLPNAKVLRFHAAVNVDYSGTAAIIKATSESPIWSIESGEGLVEQPSPNLPNSLDAMNDLLRSAKPVLKNSQLESASILYLFLLGRENRRSHSFFRQPEKQHPLSTADYRGSYQRRGAISVVTLTTLSGVWKLTYSSQRGRLHLDSVVENAGD